MKHPIGRALLSVTDKTGLAEFARGLVEIGIELVSTGGTRALLEREGVAVVDIAEVTGSPEMLDGRVKTLHPRVHGGILARRDQADHIEQLRAHAIEPIGLVVVNLYAFEKTVAQPNVSPEEAVESIDIGGPTMLRAAAKNFADVLAVVDPADYASLLESLRKNDVSLAQRRQLAHKVFEHTARYDRAIADWFAASAPSATTGHPATLSLQFEKQAELRYGENPHQSAAFYADRHAPLPSLAKAEQRGGKELSYNNLLDADSAMGAVRDLAPGSVVYVKHNNPCGAATQAVLADAVRVARACDAVSAFGAVVALNAPVDRATAEVLAETFLEVVLAPEFSPEAEAVFASKKNLRILRVPGLTSRDGETEAPLRTDLRRVAGGLLVQSADDTRPLAELGAARVVTQRAPTDEERAALAFAWRMVKHVRSNAIVFASPDRVVAVGAGQMSRVDSVAICRHKVGDALKGSAVASDAFFPFRDGVDILAAAGATAVIQPGGSVRDEEVIRAADEHGLAMLLTGVRHFRH